MRSLPFYRILAESDKKLFLNTIKKLGFVIEGKCNINPLVKSVEEARIFALSKKISEDIDEFENLSPELKAIQELAEALGFIVSYEGAPPKSRRKN